MPLSDTQAEQIAKLLNERNELVVAYNRDKVLKASESYRIRLSPTGTVAACVQIKELQWYQFEILHLTVDEAYEGQGFGKDLLCEAERVARAKRARILQCTVREDNDRSRGLFEKSGFRRVSVFFNERSGKNIGVFQKVLEPAR